MPVEAARDLSTHRSSWTAPSSCTCGSTPRSPTPDNKNPIVGFAIAGKPTGSFQPARATWPTSQIGKDGNATDPSIDRKAARCCRVHWCPIPIHFRYAWGRNPLANLQVAGNKDLPVATQRSDDWDMGTVPLGVLEVEIEGKLSRAQRNRVLQALRLEDLRRRLAEAEALLLENGGALEMPEPGRGR